VIGLGNAGWNLHLPALAALPSATVVGACDLDASRRDRASARYGIPVFERIEEMIDRAAPEVVIVATPPEHHVDACMRTLTAGAHVVCEKPLATSVADGRRILATARSAGRRVAMNYEFRAMPIAAAVLQHVGLPGIGPLHFAHVWQSMDLPPWKEPGWRGALSRGVLYEAGIHLVDYALALFGERPQSVSASMSTCGVRDEKTDSVALVTMEFSGGRLAQITQNRLSPGDTRYFEVSAECADATLRASYGGRARLSVGLVRAARPHIRVEYGPSGIAWQEKGWRRRVLARNPREGGMHATRRLLEQTLDAFANGGDAVATGETGLLGLEVLAACYHSADTGARVSLDAATIERLADHAIGQ
jgi:predicted dehydrogenase